MAFNDYDDYEKSELVTQWLRENALAIISGIVLGLLLIFGINQWRNHQVTHRVEAANEYQTLLSAIQTGQQGAVEASASKLKSEYKNTAFAVFSSFQQASQAIAAGKPADAVMPLQWAREHASNAALKALAQLRLARVQLAAGDANAALETLETMPKGSYAGMAKALRGDALVALDKTAAARTAYQDALDSFEPGALVHNLVQLKLDNLATPGKRKS